MALVSRAPHTACAGAAATMPPFVIAAVFIIRNHIRNHILQESTDGVETIKGDVPEPEMNQCKSIIHR